MTQTQYLCRKAALDQARAIALETVNSEYEHQLAELREKKRENTLNLFLANPMAKPQTIPNSNQKQA